MKTPSCLRSSVAAGFISLAALVTPAAGQAPAPAREEVLVLPDIKVTDSADLPPPESWHYARIGSFEVLSNASERSTRSLLADFAKFTQAMQLVWPVPAKPLAASTLILCGKGGKFDAFPPAGATRDEAIVPSLFLRNREQVAIIVDVESERVTIDASNLQTVIASSAEYEVDHYKQLYREYVRYLLSQNPARVPIWVEEGLAQIVMDIELTGSALIYGKINSFKGAAAGGEAADSDGTDATASTGAIVGEQPFNAVLQHRKLIPLDQFFALPADAPETHSPLGNNLWAKQAYAFVHFCLFGENLRYRTALSTFVTRLAREPLSEALFAECFGTDYRGMTKELRGYILHTRHKYQRYLLLKSDRLTEKSIELREATQAEVALIKGDALRLGGHLDTAFTAYRTGYLRGARESALLAGLGMTESGLNQADRAREHLEAATRAKVARPSAHIELARLRLAETAVKGQLSPAQVDALLATVMEARNFPPMLPETYEVIAAVWARSEAAPKPENLAVLDEGIRAFPRNSALLTRAAQLYHRAGADATALSIIKLGLRFTTDPAVIARFEEILATLPPTRAAR